MRSLAVLGVLARCACGIDVWFFNNHSAPYELFWMPPDGSAPVGVGTLESGGNLTHSTFAGHTFGYVDVEGNWQTTLVEATTAHVVLMTARGEGALDVIFRNEMAVDAELYWEPTDGSERLPVGAVEAHGGQMVQLTHRGKRFSFDDDCGKRHVVEVSASNSFIVMACDVIRVRCDLVDVAHPLDFEVIPEWAPRGAARFLDMVRNDFFDRLVFHRVISTFVASFGIHRDRWVRMHYHENMIVDDAKRGTGS